MFIAKEELKLHALIKNPVAWLLFLNGLFVIGSYALSNFTGGTSIGFVRVFKNIFLFISLAYLIISGRIINPGRIFDSGLVPVIFGILIFYVSIPSSVIGESLSETSTFFIPFIYVYLSLSYLIANFGIKLTLKGLHYSVLIIYSIPLITYLLSGGSIRNTNIYVAGNEALLFASNNYGWSATLYILSYLFVRKDIKLKKISKIFFGILLLVAVILFFTSASRSSWFSMSVTMIPFFISYKAMSLKYKVVVIILALGFISFLLADPNSSINFAKEKSKKQEQSGEARFETAKIVYDHFNDQPTLWITGTGLFDFGGIKNKAILGGYHNSYWYILFGVGIPLFLVFLSFMVFRPMLRFIRYYSKYTLLFAPLLIIPFFESDLTGGQFLFYPWFTYMLLLNAKIKYW